ncbi:S-layer homology domain-containing protein [Cohnella sp. LGH]|uniref:S-layer homology domain-containing protein n=1 Tax=Cohnella sp. LGH TaxID=1619153 RepID=UPI001ADD60C4|nr:S-layer homology domain-containing protein [Cohnella sp. LGH]QTH40478.1 S-layer homology domain-containing protein [Cohnella sp. LGH]
MNLSKRFVFGRMLSLSIVLLFIAAAVSGCINTKGELQFEIDGHTLQADERLYLRLQDGSTPLTSDNQAGQASFSIMNPDYKRMIGGFVHDSATGISWVPRFEYEDVYNSSKVYLSEIAESKPRAKPIAAIQAGRPVADPNRTGFVSVTYAVYGNNREPVDDRTEIYIEASEQVTFYDNEPRHNSQTQSRAMSSFTDKGLVTFTMMSSLIDSNDPDLSAIPIALYSGPTPVPIVTGGHAELSALSLSTGALFPEFDPSITSYVADVAYGVSSLSVTASVYDVHALLTVNGTEVSSGQASEAIGLNVGSNPIRIDVTPLTGEVQTYTVTVRRGAAGSSSNGGGSGAASHDDGPLSSTNGRLTLPVGRAGLLSLGEAVRVSVPAGAAERELILVIEEVLDTGKLLFDKERLLSSIFEITKNVPENFKRPVTLKLAYDSARLAEGQKPVVFYYDEASAQWVEIGGAAADGLLSVQVDHFTKFAVFAVGSEQKPAEPKFSDIGGHWAEDAILEAAGKGLVSGYANGSFRPNAPVSRAEFAVMLMNALGMPADEAAESGFTDVAGIGEWARKGVAQASQAGIVSGYADGSFRPNTNVSRAEIAVMLARASRLSLPEGSPTSFADDRDIPAWAKAAAEELNRLELMKGRGGSFFRPKESATRAEAATVMLRFVSYRIFANP